MPGVDERTRQQRGLDIAHSAARHHSSRQRANSSSHRFFIPPDFEQEHSFNRFQLVDHGPVATPPVLLVEAGGAIVSYRACEPGDLDAVGEKPRFTIRKQCRGSTRAARVPRDKELIEFVALHDAESCRSAGCADDADIGKRGSQPVPKARQRAHSRELGRHQVRVRFTPPVEPELRQQIDLRRLGRSDVHICGGAAGSDPFLLRHVLEVRRQILLGVAQDLGDGLAVGE